MYGGGAAAAAAAIANAIKASGSIIELEPDEFLKLVQRAKDAPVVTSRGGFIKKDFRYLSVYHGLFIYCKAPEALALPGDIEIINAKKIWIPG